MVAGRAVLMRPATLRGHAVTPAVESRRALEGAAFGVRLHADLLHYHLRLARTAGEPHYLSAAQHAAAGLRERAARGAAELRAFTTGNTTEGEG